MTGRSYWLVLAVISLGFLGCRSDSRAEQAQGTAENERVLKLPDGRAVHATWSPASRTLDLEFSTDVDRSNSEAVEGEVEQAWKAASVVLQTWKASKAYVHVRFPREETASVTNLTTGFSYERGDDGLWYRRAGFSRDKRDKPVVGE
jgi:hypothetical protein